MAGYETQALISSLNSINHTLETIMQELASISDSLITMNDNTVEIENKHNRKS